MAACRVRPWFCCSCLLPADPSPGRPHHGPGPASSILRRSRAAASRAPSSASAAPATRAAAVAPRRPKALPRPRPSAIKATTSRTSAGSRFRPALPAAIRTFGASPSRKAATTRAPWRAAASDLARKTGFQRTGAILRACWLSVVGPAGRGWFRGGALGAAPCWSWPLVVAGVRRPSTRRHTWTKTRSRPRASAAAAARPIRRAHPALVALLPSRSQEPHRCRRPPPVSPTGRAKQW